MFYNDVDYVRRTPPGRSVVPAGSAFPALFPGSDLLPATLPGVHTAFAGAGIVLVL
jgi:hypothetical protein